MATSRSTPPSRSTARTRPAKAPAPSWSPLANVPEKYHTPIYIAFILLTLVVFFGGVIFGGKFFATSDNVGWLSFVPYLDKMASAGEHPFWLPYIFSGMPGYAAYLVTGDRWWDLSMKLVNVVEHTFAFGNFFTMRIILHYFLFGTGMYLWMRVRKLSRPVSAYVGIAAMFSTWVIVYIMIGHNTKVSVLMTIPFIFLCVDKLYERFSLLYAALLVLVIHIMAEMNHPQTALYGGMAIGIYLVFEVIALLKAGDTKGAGRRGLTIALLVVAVLGAVGMGLDRYAAIREYNPYSTRSEHDYQYATEWSFSPEETITYLVPSYFGFGEVEVTAPGVQSQRMMTYWGQMPFTDAGHYVGIGVLLLAAYGFWANRRSRFAWAMLTIGLFGLLLSYGRNMSLLYDLLYNVLPGFKQFRAPSQSLLLLEIALPVLAGLGLRSAFQIRDGQGEVEGARKIDRLLYIFGGAMIGGLLLIMAMKDSYFSAIADARGAVWKDGLPVLQEFIFNTMRTDWIFSIVFGCATLLLLSFFAKGRMSAVAFMAALVVITCADLWRVDYRPMKAVPLSQAMAVFQPTDLDRAMQEDTTQHRMLDLRIFYDNGPDLTAPKPNYPARQFHEHIGGYHAAKMKIYQDLLDSTGGTTTAPLSPMAWNILNTKYLVSPTANPKDLEANFPGVHVRLVKASESGGGFLMENLDALPRAWFVNRVEVLDEKQTLSRIKTASFDPRDVAFVTEALKTTVAPVGYTPSAAAAPVDTAAHDSTAPPPAAPPTAPANLGNGKVSVHDYTPNHFALHVEAPGTNFLVISEIYYPCWQATLDGKPAEIIRTNSVLRGMVIPPGKHTVEMHYQSAGFETGKYLSLGLNIAVFAAIGVGFMLERKRRANAGEAAPAQPAAGDEHAA